MQSTYIKKIIFEQKCMPFFLYKRLLDFSNWLKNFEWEMFYFNQVFIRRILKSKAITCDQQSTYEIHMLTGHKDFLQALWCLKTYYHYARVNPLLVIHGDGTLTHIHKSILETHFKNCRVILRKDTENDLKKYLAGHQYCLDLRFGGPETYKRIKMFDFYNYASTKHILILDSDILFFKKPQAILDMIEREEMFYMDDAMNDYTFSAEHIEEKFDVSLLKHFNSGLVYAPVSIQNLDCIDEFLKECIEQDCYRLSEQTTRALLFSKYCPEATKLDNTYQIANDSLDDHTVMHHFVNNGFRENNYINGLKLLKENQFLQKSRKRDI